MLTLRTRLATLLATSSLIVGIPAFAQTAPAPAASPDAPPQASATGAHDSPHDQRSPERDIVVVGHPPTDFGLLAATGSISGDTLVSKMRSQIGEILNSLPGVSSTSFAPGASRPVLRGFSGDRVSVLTDGIGSLDASNVSVDHAVVFDALTVDHIDVYHGPSVLLFGGNAIGGAVNAIDKRIPRQVPDAITGTAIGSYATAAEERAVSGAVDIPLAPRLVAHFDASWRKSDDLRIGGHVYSEALRSEMLEAANVLRAAGQTDRADEIADEAGLSGRLPNSAARTTTLGAGVAFIDAGGNLGISVQRFDTRYGVPGRPSTGLDEGEGAVDIDLAQTRLDLRGELKLSGPFESLQVRGAYADYHHSELEGDEVGTRFAGKGIEFRTDLVQTRRGGWRGRSGLQYLTRKLAVTGDEAVVPDYTIDRIGFFTLQSLEIGGGFEIEGAGRFDQSKVHSNEGGFDRRFDLWSGAAGLSWKSGSGISLGANYVHGERAPSPEELLSDGVHVATQSFESGDRTLDSEASNGIEAYLRYQGTALGLSLTGYLTHFDNYIAPLNTGEEIEGFPVYQYTGVKAVFKGFEASGNYQAFAWDGGSLGFDAAADYTHARIEGIGPVPRIPPLRIRGGTELKLGNLNLRGEVEWNARQDRVGANESPTDAFTIVNLSADWHPFGEDGPVTIMLAADNLFDVVGRRSASFTSDFVPIAGRDVRLTTKFTF